LDFRLSILDCGKNWRLCFWIVGRRLPISESKIQNPKKMERFRNVPREGLADRASASKIPEGKPWTGEFYSKIQNLKSKMPMTEREFKEKTKAAALRAIKLVESLPPGRSGDVIGRQLLRSATSAAANYRAVQNHRRT
jgi:hypothetical protein